MHKMAADSDLNNTLPDFVLNLDNEENEVNVSSHQEDNLGNEYSQLNTPECQEAGPSQHSSSLNNKQSNYDDQKSTKTEIKSTPRRTHVNNSRGNKIHAKPGTSQQNIRLCEQHSFLTDITEVRQMEQGLLKLLDDFHSGKLQAFGKDSIFEKMEQVREQQERLARMHFELNGQEEIYGSECDEGRNVGRDNLGKLLENLNQLSHSIEQLQISSPSIQTDV